MTSHSKTTPGICHEQTNICSIFRRHKLAMDMEMSKIDGPPEKRKKKDKKIDLDLIFHASHLSATVAWKR